MGSLALLADEHVKQVFVTELRANGYDIVAAADRLDPGTPDRALLVEARTAERVVLTNDADFARLDGTHDHCGIVVYDDQAFPVTEFVAAMNAIERHVPRDELRNEILWLDAWR